MKRRTLLLFVVGIVVIGGVFGFLKYNERTPGASDRGADVSVDAVTLFQAFTADEMAAGKVYNDKVVEVSGKVRDVDAGSGGPYNVSLETGDPLGAIVCEFEPSSAPAWKVGDAVRLKGFCAGYNMDVLLQRCAAVE